MASVGFEISVEEKEALAKLKKTEQGFQSLESQAVKSGKAIDTSFVGGGNKALSDMKSGVDSVGGGFTSMADSASKGGTKSLGAISSIKTGLHSLFAVMVANPVIAILAAIVAIFGALVKAINSSEESSNRFQLILAPLKWVFDKLLGVLQKFVGFLLDGVEAMASFAMVTSKLLERLPFVGDAIKDINTQIGESIKLQGEKNQLIKDERTALIAIAKNEKDIAELRAKAEDKSAHSAKERLAFIQQANKLEQESADQELNLANERLRIAKKEAERNEGSAADNDYLARLEADAYKAQKNHAEKKRSLSRKEQQLNQEINADNKKALQERQKILDAELKIETKHRQDILSEKKRNIEFEKAEIELQNDSFSKRQKMIDLQHRQELQSIDERAEELLRKQQEIERLVWEKKGKEGLFTPTAESVNDLSDSAKKELDKRKELSDKTRDYNKAANKEQSEEALKEYRTLEQKKLKLRDEYSKKIVEAQTLGLDGDVITNLNKSLEDGIAALNFEELKKGIDWGVLFGDLESVTTQSLEHIISTLETLRDKNSEAWKPEQLKVFNDQIGKGKLLLADKKPFEILKGGYAEYKQATQDVIESQKKLDEAVAHSGLGSEETAKATKELSEAENRRAVSLRKTTQAANSLAQKGNQVVNAGRELTEMLGNLGVEMSETVAKALDGIGQIWEGIEKVDLTKPFTLVTGGVSVLSGIGNTIAGIFGGASSELSDKVFEQFDSLMQTLDKVIAKQKEMLNSLAGAEAVKQTEKAIELVNLQIEANRKLGDEFLNSGAKWNKRSHGVRLQRELKQYRDEFNKIGVDFDSLGGRMDGLFSLSAEKLQEIQEKIPTAWSKMDANTRDFLQGIIDGEEKILELQEQMQEALTGTSFDNFLSGAINAINDFRGDIEGLADFTEEQMTTAMLNSFKRQRLNESLKPLYDELGEIFSNDIQDLNQKDIENWKTELNRMLGLKSQELDELFKAFGLDSDAPSSQQGGSKGYSISMDQSTGDEILGNVRALHMTNISMDESLRLIEQRQQIDSVNLSQMTSDVQSLVSASLQSMYYLANIEKHTSHIPAMASDIADVKRNTKEAI